MIIILRSRLRQKREKQREKQQQAEREKNSLKQQMRILKQKQKLLEMQSEHCKEIIEEKGDENDGIVTSLLPGYEYEKKLEDKKKD